MLQLDLRDCGATWKSFQNDQTPVARIHLEYFFPRVFLFFCKFVAIRFREKCFTYIIQIFSNKEHIIIYRNTKYFLKSACFAHKKKSRNFYFIKIIILFVLFYLNFILFFY